MNIIKRLMKYAAQLNFDLLLGCLLLAAGIYFYTLTLAPTVLEGDKALFQYTPHVLGVTYPTGFPLYILIGKIWLVLFPFGEIAWRMNFFSALCAAATLPLLYNAIRRLLASRWAAFTVVLIFATLPTFWHWSTVAKTYPLNMLLLAGILYLLAQGLERKNAPRNTKYAIRNTFLSRIAYSVSPLALPVLLLGLQISVHNTAVLLIPGLLLLAWLNFKSSLLNKKLWPLHTALLVLPGLFYLYIPLRAEWLLAHYGREQAIARGLLADFYQSGLSGWITYFTAAEFTGGVVTKWGLIPERFLSVYVPLLVDNFTWPLIILAVIGGLALAVRRPRLFWPLFLIYAVPIPFVLTYDQGEQSAFLIPSFLMVAIAIGGLILLIDWPAIQNSKYEIRYTNYILRLIPPLFLLALIPFHLLPQLRANINWLTHKWDRSIYEEWRDNLNHPLGPNATMLAHWGDLTSFWYLQHAEGRRPDLLGLYPPAEDNVVNWFSAGHQNLYIAGELQGWAPGIQERFQLIPWGRLVRIAPPQAAPETLLPNLPIAIETTFQPVEANQPHLRFIAANFPPEATGGSDYPVTLTWQTLAELPPETSTSLRLVQGDTIVAQLDDTLISGWFPSDTLAAGQHGLTYAPIPIPLGTLPGQYQLQLVVYTGHRNPWLYNQDAAVLNLGQVEIVSPPAARLTSAESYLPPHTFNGEIELADYSYSVSRVGQGKGFAVKLLWRAQQQPADNYTLQVDQVDTAGNVIRSQTHQPVKGRTSTAMWQPGQFILDQVDVVVPASAPSGEEALYIRLSWLRPDGSALNVRKWFLPAGHSLTLGGMRVLEKEGRVFDVPSIQTTLNVNLQNKVRLLGFDVSSSSNSTSTDHLAFFSRSICQTEGESCQIQLDLYWQDIEEMAESYLVFLHVIDEAGRIITQHDRAPGHRGKEPTTAWLPGEVVADPINIRLPADISPGSYKIFVGMYLPPDGPRLLVVDEAGSPIADAVEIGTINITP